VDKKLTYIVLGGSGGIGSQVCRRLIAKGANVVVGARNVEKLDSHEWFSGAHAFAVDATDLRAVEALVNDTAGQFGGIDGIVNCVGSMMLKPAHLTSEQDWMDTIHVNLTSSFAAVKAGVKAMMKTGGSIVLMSSAAARTGLANHEAIAAAKAGVIGLMLSAAASYAARGVRVNCVAPGLVRTPMTERITSNEKSLQASQMMHPLGRIGEPDEVASAIEWLLDPANGWVTGQVIGLDGGLATVRTSARG
jgi:NAD(P)-dependent dehydrogenase (short-subunit alcohol dehydrogenase family)